MAIFSYSAYSKYKKCPEMYRLEYVAHEKPQIKQNVRPFLEGAMVARTVELTLKRRPADIKYAMQLASTVFDEVIAEQQSKGIFKLNPKETLDTIKDKARGLLDSSITMIMKMGLDSPDTYNEHWFGTYKAPIEILPGVFVHGAADFLKIGPETFEIYDLKTSKDTTYLDIDQLWIYLLSAEKKFGKKPGRVAFMMARDGRLIFLTIDDKNREHVVGKLIDAASKMNAGQYIPTPSEKLCGSCLYNLQCKSAMRGYSTQATMNFADFLDGKTGGI